MTPVSHSFFGFTAGFVISPITEKLGLSRARTVLLCTAGSLLPDIDSISVFLNQKIYYGKDWYSHHALSHSIFGSLLLATVVMMIIQPFLTVRMFKSRSALKKWVVSLAVLYIGCLIHLPCDMVTFKGIWGGIPLFAPFSWSRFGGWYHMPWKDYYVIYMAIATYLVFVSIWLIEFLLRKKTLLLPVLSAVILVWAVYYVSESRFINYSKWEKNQKSLVGEVLYGFAEDCSVIVMSKVWGKKNR